jgi:hypothetical protein
VYKTDFVQDSAKFYLSDEIPPIGTNILHVGSLLGQQGSNSMTTGIVSQIGRVLTFGAHTVIFDQTTATAFPGSSGGGVFMGEGEHTGEYVGMLVRGAGETFNLIVPVRRMKEFAKENDLMWALDPALEAPCLKEVDERPIEGSFEQQRYNKDDKPPHEFEAFPTFIGISEE